MDKKSEKLENILGIAIMSELVIGIVGVLAAGIAIFNGEWIGVGLCLGASALAFGLLVNGILRD